MAERLAFLFHWPTVARTEMASDVSCERSQLLDILFHGREAFWRVMQKHAEAREVYEKQLKDYQAKRLPRKPTPPAIGPLPQFLDFIRTPFQVSFQVLPRQGCGPDRRTLAPGDLAEPDLRAGQVRKQGDRIIRQDA